jgi:hypothetical protein
MNSWKNRLKGKSPMETPQSAAQLEERRNQLCMICGQKQFSVAVLKAELVQHNQEILDINNKLGKIHKDAVGEAKPAVPPETIPAPTVVEQEAQNVPA